MNIYYWSKNSDDSSKYCLKCHKPVPKWYEGECKRCYMGVKQ